MNFSLSAVIGVYALGFLTGITVLIALGQLLGFVHLRVWWTGNTQASKASNVMENMAALGYTVQLKTHEHSSDIVFVLKVGDADNPEMVREVGSNLAEVSQRAMARIRKIEKEFTEAMGDGE